MLIFFEFKNRFNKYVDQFSYKNRYLGQFLDCLVEEMLREIKIGLVSGFVCYKLFFGIRVVKI